MSISPQLPTSAEKEAPHPVRSSSVIMGRQDYLSVTLRLIGMELYKLRRRRMSKVVGGIAAALAIILFLLISLGTVFTLNAPAASFNPQSCQAASNPAASPVSGNPGPGQPTNCPTPSSAQLEQLRHDALESVSTPLRLPISLNFAVQFALTPCTALIIILIGTMVGGEYSVGTIRLLFTRGPTRTQFLLAKLGAAIISVLIGIVIMVILGVLTGQALNPLSGFPQTSDLLDASWVGHALLYLLIAMLNWFMYGAIAVFFGILGRSTVAGIVGALTWFFVEPILSGVLSLISNFSRGPFGDILKAIPDYFIGNNFGALLGDQAHYLFGYNPPTLSIIHALIVLPCYFVLFIGLAWWLNKKRDITN
jgi:ABC-type transport system involved in multi-copper enzyme maturation permease subunit